MIKMKGMTLLLSSFCPKIDEEQITAATHRMIIAVGGCCRSKNKLTKE